MRETKTGNAAVPAASSGGVSPSGATPGGDAGRTRRRDACATKLLTILILIRYSFGAVRRVVEPQARRRNSSERRIFSLVRDRGRASLATQLDRGQRTICDTGVEPELLNWKGTVYG